MKGFIKFASILTFGMFCFFAGFAKGHGKNGLALYCILGGTMMLLNGCVTVTEIETNELMEKNRKRTDELLKKTAKLGSKMKEIGK